MAQPDHAATPIPHEPFSSGAVPSEANRDGSVAAYAITATPLTIHDAAVPRMSHVDPAGGGAPNGRVDITVGTSARSNDGRAILRNSDGGTQEGTLVQKRETAARKFRRIRRPTVNSTAIIGCHYFAIFGKGIVRPRWGHRGVDEH